MAPAEEVDNQALEPVKLLLVDDREEDLGVLRLMLNDPAYEIHSVRSGSEALKLLLREDFAVILLDVMLPIMDGFEIASMIKERERSRHTPILFLTAAGGDMKFIYRAYSVGAVDYLPKPIDPDVVRAKVAIFADLFRKDRRIRRQAEELRQADLRQKELELAELQRVSERRYQNLCDAIPAIVWTAGRDGSLEYANRRWHDYTGLGRARTRHWGWLNAVHASDRQPFEQEWRAALARQIPHTAECRLRAHDGTYHAHLCQVIPERGPDGEVVGWVATMMDCEDLRQAIRARDEFLAVASHELRTPLSTLDLVLYSVRKLVDPLRDPDNSPRLLKKLGVAERQTGRLNKLVSALLDVTRIAGERDLIEPEACDLARIAQEVVERLQDEASRHGSPISLAGAASIPGVWDPLRIDQVLTNLLTNAIRYGGGKPIEMVIEQDKVAARLHVRDQGPGIAPEHLPRLFGRFQRADAATHQAGLGLGLFISRHIARAHGGDITVTSEPGLGATFTIELPVEAPTVPGTPEAEAVGERQATG